MEDIFYRQMPHSLEAEQSVLGSMLIDANCVKDVMEQLRPDDFYLKQNREIFETIYSMFVYSKPIDGVTVAGEMEKNGTYEESTTRPYLAQLMDVTPTSANVMEYVGIVRDKALLRETARELLGRYLFAAVSAALVFFCTPFELVVRARRGGAENIRRAPRAQRAEHGEHRRRFAGRSGPSERAERQRRQDAAGSSHGLWRTGRQNEWPQQIGPCAAGRASRYG